jgi:hypothetical protein
MSRATSELSASPSTPGFGVPTPDIMQRTPQCPAIQASCVLAGCLVGGNSGSPLLSPSGRWVPGCLLGEVCPISSYRIKFSPCFPSKFLMQRRVILRSSSLCQLVLPSKRETMDLLQTSFELCTSARYSPVLDSVCVLTYDGSFCRTVLSIA